MLDFCDFCGKLWILVTCVFVKLISFASPAEGIRGFEDTPFSTAVWSLRPWITLRRHLAQPQCKAYTLPVIDARCFAVPGQPLF